VTADHDLDLDAELAALVEVGTREQRAVEAVARFKRRLGARLQGVVVDETRRLAGDLEAIGGVTCEDAASWVAGYLREVADEVERDPDAGAT